MLRAILSIASAQAIGILLGIFRSKLLATVLGSAGFGIVATIDQLVTSSIQILNFSIPFAALKFLSKAHSQGEETFRQAYTGFARGMLWLTIIATGISLAVIPPLLGRLDTQLAAYRSSVILALLGIPAAMLLMFFINALAARQESSRSAAISVISAAVLLISGGAGCLLGGINGFYLGTVPAATLLIMVIWWHFKRKYPASQQSGNFGGILKLASPSVLKFSLQIYITTASTAIQLLVARYVSLSSMDAHSAGLLQAVLAIGLSVGAVVGPANILFFAPYINRDLPPPVKMTAANDLIPRLLLLFCLGATPVLLLPELTLRVLYSKDFVGASGILPWFILWQCQFHISSVYQQLLLGLEDTTGYCWITASGNILAAILSVLLVPHFGLSGIGFGFVFSTVYTTVVTLTRLKLRHGIGITPRAISLICISFFGFAAMAVIGGVAPEMPSFGAAVRCTAAIVFLSAIWAGLPTTLKRDLLATFQARIRAFARSGSANPSS